MILSKVRFKNFFSAGNDFVEVDLLKFRRSVTSGANGMGKSTVLNAIVYALFKKTIKKITKSQIINSINGKNCVVELEGFVDYLGGKSFMIRRGIKPDVFNVMVDGKPLDEKLSGDFQDYVEEHIVKASYRTFIQTSIISVENYIPFMSLPAGERRLLIEDILDIQVFSVMNQLTKADDKKNKDELKVVNSELVSLKDKIILLKNHIASVETIVDSNTDAINDEIKQNKALIRIDQKRLGAIRAELDELSNSTEAISSQRRLHASKTSDISALKSQIKTKQKTLSFFTDNTNCPTCTQPIDPKNVGSLIETHTCEISTWQEQIEAIQIDLDSLGDVYEKSDEHSSKLSTLKSSISELERNIVSAEKKILSLEKELAAPKVDTDTSEQREQMKELAKRALKVKERQAELGEEQAYNALMLELLKDSGIKSKIVDQYLPVINRLMNDYLEKLDLFVSFTFDSEFNETVKSRHRDLFTYNSFSAGEKQRIDLAILFTLRRLAVLKSSFECNILGADEVLDAAVDEAGVTLLNDILMSEEFDKTNLMVISHRNTAIFQDLFDGRYIMSKRDGFSQLDIVND